MTTEIDHDVIKTDIVGILQADTTNLYDTGVHDGTKCTQIEVGYPNNVKNGKPVGHKAFIYVTNFTPHTIRPTSNVISDAFESLTHQFRYLIVIGCALAKARDTEKQLDAFEKVVLENLEADNQLKNGSTANVDTSYPEQILDDPVRKGQSYQERKIVLFCQKETG